MTRPASGGRNALRQARSGTYQNENTAKNSGVLLLLLFAYDQKIFKTDSGLSCLNQPPVCFFYSAPSSIALLTA